MQKLNFSSKFPSHLAFARACSRFTIFHVKSALSSTSLLRKMPGIPIGRAAGGNHSKTQHCPLASTHTTTHSNPIVKKKLEIFSLDLDLGEGKSGGLLNVFQCLC